MIYEYTWRRQERGGTPPLLQESKREKKKYIKKHKSDLKSLADIVKEQQEGVEEFLHHTHKYAR
jgi:hypothetical protein